MLWAFKNGNTVNSEKIYLTYPLIHATEPMAFYNQKEIIFYNKAVMWFFSVREAKEEKGNIHFRGSRRRDFHQVCLVLSTLERNISCFFITLLNHMGTSGSE